MQRPWQFNPSYHYKTIRSAPPSYSEELIGRCWKTTAAMTVVQPLQGAIPRSFPPNLQLDRSILGEFVGKFRNIYKGMMINSGIYSLETLRWTGPKMLSMPIRCLYVYSDLFLFVICYCFIQVFSWSTLSRRESWPQCPPTMGAKTGVQNKIFFLDFFKYVHFCAFTVFPFILLLLFYAD